MRRSPGTANESHVCIGRHCAVMEMQPIVAAALQISHITLMSKESVKYPSSADEFVILHPLVGKTSTANFQENALSRSFSA